MLFFQFQRQVVDHVFGKVQRCGGLLHCILPAEALGRDELEIFIDNDRVVLQKCEQRSSCVFCGADQELQSYRGKNICRDCLEKMRQL